MSNAPESTSPRRTPWGWLLVGLPLGAWAYYSLFEDIQLNWELTCFLVLLAGWLGGQYGWRAIKPMLLLGVCAIFSFYGRPFGEVLTIGHGFAPPEFLLGVFVCAAFARIRDGWPASPDNLVRNWWPPALWLATLVLAVSAFRGTKIQSDIVETVVWTWDIGAMAALAILLSPIRWVNLLHRLRPHVPVFLATTLFVVALAALCLNVSRSGEDIVGFDIGLAYSEHWLLVLSFVLTAARLMDWRLLVGLLIAVFIGVTLVSDSNEELSLVPLPFSEDSSDYAVLLTWHTLIYCICAALLGVVLRPFLLDWNIAPLRNWRTVAILGVILVLYFAVVPLYSGVYVRDQMLILGGVAFVGTLVWRGKGLVAIPFVILLGAVAANPLASDEISEVLLGRLMRVAWLIFPFAFLGLLANRYERASPAPGTEVSP